MDDREKLVELQLQADIADNVSENTTQHREFTADFMMANGVTVQEWISVNDRLPDNKEHDWVLAQAVEDNGFMHIPKVMEYRQQRNDWYEETYGWLSEHNGAFTVTHWMPPAPTAKRITGKDN